MPLDRRPVEEPRTVYRFVHVDDVDDPKLVEDFRSDRESGKRPVPREKAIPELQDGMSTFGSLSGARDQWQTISEAAAKRDQAVRVGYYIAEVELVPDRGYSVEDLDEPNEPLTTWGEANRLAEDVRRIYPAAIS